MGALCTVSGPSFMYSSSFFKNLNHDYMKKNKPVNWDGICTKTNRSMVLHEIFTSLERE